MSKLGEFFEDHLRAVLILLIAVIAAVFIAIIVSVLAGGETERSLTVADISGNVFIMKNDGRIPAVKNMTIGSGDLVVTAEESYLKLKADNGKFIYVEPSSTIYVYYTKKAAKGSMIVNISDGSALCRLDEKLSKNETFEVRTPNSVTAAAGTVFHVDFNYYETLGDYTNVMLTDVKCIEGEVNLQSYDISGNKVDTLMQLMQGNAAEMLSADGHTAYNYLNQPYVLTDISSDVLQELIKVSAERTLPYTLADLNDAYVTVKGRSSAGAFPTPPPVTAPVTQAEFTAPQISDAQFDTAASEDDTPAYFTYYEYDDTTDTETETEYSVTAPTTADVSEIASFGDTSSDITSSGITSSVTSSPETTTSSTSAAVSSAPAVTAATTAAPVYTAALRTSAAPVYTAAPRTSAAPVYTTTTTAASPAVTVSSEAALPPVTVFTVPQVTEEETTRRTRPTETEAPAVTTTTAAPAPETAAPAETATQAQTSASLNWWEMINSGNE